METSKRGIGFGARGTLLTLYCFLSYIVWIAFTNYPNNVLAGAYGEMHHWNVALVATCYSLGSFVSVILQLFINKRLANSNVKRTTLIMSVITIVLGFCLAVITNQPLFLLLYVIVRIFGDLWVQLGNGVLVGRWFPVRKGTVMGISTFAFPIGTGIVLSVFVGLFMKNGTLGAFAPFLIIGVLCVLILAFLLSNYPEEVGAFRDNDKSMTKEKAEELMQMEEHAKKTSVWTLKRCVTTKDFWFLVIPEGMILFASVGFMVQIISVLSSMGGGFYEQYGQLVLGMITLVACLGSWLLGVIDTRFGTKTQSPWSQVRRSARTP